MKLLILKYLALMTALVSIGIPVAAEDLDEALAAQKKKVQRRVYSDRAVLDDRSLTVPSTPTDQEQALDRKLREMDAKANARLAPPVRPALSYPTTIVPQSAENENWLTPALLDDAAAVSMPDETETVWLTRELKRQNELKTQKSTEKENMLVEKLLREKNQLQNSSPELNRLKQYQLTPQTLVTGGDKKTTTPPYLPLQSESTDPLKAVHLSSKKEPPVAPPLFSLEAARISASMDKDPLRSTRSPALTPNLAPLSRKPSSGLSPALDSPEESALTPMDLLRKSSPINRPNPFEDNDLQELKGTLWK